MTLQVPGSNVWKPMRLDILSWTPSRQDRLSSLRRNILAASVCCSPPGVCRRSPDQISKTGAWSTRNSRRFLHITVLLPFVLQHYIYLFDPVRHWVVWWPHSCKKPPPQSMSKDFFRMWLLRFSTGMSIFFGCQLLGYVSQAVLPSVTTTRKGQFPFVKSNKNIHDHWPKQ